MESNIQTYMDIKTQSDAVLHFLQHLDIEMIDAVLIPDRTYQDFDKHIFIKKLGSALDEFIQSGDTYLKMYAGNCDSEFCRYQYKGFRFIGNNSCNYLDVIVDIKAGFVQDIYECSVFKLSANIPVAGKKIKIDLIQTPF